MDGEDKKYRLGILGGCFPVQEEIPEEEIYHGILAKRLFNETGIVLVPVIKRYDLLCDCTTLLCKLIKEGVDAVLLHIRPENYMQNLSMPKEKETVK